MPTATTAPNKGEVKRTTGVLADLAAVEDAAARIAGRIRELSAEQLALGGRPPAHTTATIPGIKSDIKLARADALRRGGEPDLAKPQAALAAAVARADEVADEIAAAQVAAKDCDHEREQLLADHHEELVDLAVEQVKHGEQLLAGLAVLALDVGDQRAVILGALRLAFGGHPYRPSATPTHEEEQARKAEYRTFEPWAKVNTPASNALWTAIQTVSTPPAQ
jgi:hypothetical protein